MSFYVKQERKKLENLGRIVVQPTLVTGMDGICTVNSFSE